MREVIDFANGDSDGPSGFISSLRSRIDLRQSLALKHALDHPDDAFTIASHVARHQITHQTARKDLSELSDELGLLVKSSRGRQFVFTVPSDLNERIDRFRSR